MNALFASSLILLCSTCLEAHAASDYLEVSVTIEHQGTILSTPVLVTALGEPATIQTGPDRDSGMRFTVTPSRFDESHYLIEAKLEHGDQGSWGIVSSPVVTVEPGKSSSMALGEDRDSPEWEFTFGVVERSEPWLQQQRERPTH